MGPAEEERESEWGVPESGHGARGVGKQRQSDVRYSSIKCSQLIAWLAWNLLMTYIIKFVKQK